MVTHATPASSPTRSPIVVIVEDDRMSRRALSLLLSISGYRTQAFSSAEDALQFFLGRSLSGIALIDLELPGMSGLELIRRLEKLQPSIFPILITASDLDRINIQMRDLPLAYLRKPVDFDVVLSLLQEQQWRRRS